MVKFTINLNDMNNIKQFDINAHNFDYDIDLCSGRYRIDGKSIMGIFSLNLSKPIEVYCHCDKEYAKRLQFGLEDCILSEIEEVEFKSAL